MLDNDFYVRHNICPVQKLNDISYYVRKNFGGSVDKADEALLVLASYCLIITYEEIYETFTINSDGIWTHCVPSLIKAGFLKKLDFSNSIGVSRSCFAITSSGHRRANELCCGTNPNKYKSLKSDLSINHSYLVGYNLFSMLPLGLPFVWRREFPFTHGRWYTGNRVKGDLFVDARCSLFPDDRDRYRLLYFEEDTGQEHATVLLDKLEKYRKHRLMDSDRLKDAVIFSFADKKAHVTPNSRYIKASAYSTGKCRELMYYMAAYDIYDATSLIHNTIIDQKFLFELLTVTGALVKKNGTLVKGSTIVNREFLNEYILSLTLRRNPYQHREFNIMHSIMSFNRMMQLVEYTLSDIARLPLYAWQMAKGFPVLCMPTSLVSERLPFALMSEFPKEKDKVLSTLSSYFPGLRYESEVSRPLTISRSGNTIRLRNIFSYDIGEDKRGVVAVEFLSFDCSAWIRSALFLNYVESFEDTPVQLICVFEATEHYKRFYKLLKVKSDVGSVILDKSGVYGMMIYDLGKEHAIFTVTDYKKPEKKKLRSFYCKQ